MINKCLANALRMVSPVLFSQAASASVTDPEPGNFSIEIGPSGALSGSIKQIKKSLGVLGSTIVYHSASKREDK